MDKGRFVASVFGMPVRSPAEPPDLPYTIYKASPIPRSLDLDAETTVQLSEADRALGRLAGAGRLVENPLLLANLYLRQEAISSTRIEGTNATIDEVLDAETGGAVNVDVMEVLNYVRALRHGLDEIAAGRALTVDLMKELHALLLLGVRGEDKSPGEVRTRPNWIGGSDPVTARFVPPWHAELEALLADWEQFAGEDPKVPPLVHCALLHYQFETLHPFEDGNGRLGRLLIVLYLIRGSHLPTASLYLSSYFENFKQDYYDGLQGVRERGDAQTWLRYFLRAVAVQANAAVLRSEQLTDLVRDYRSRLAGSRSRAHELIDGLIDNPWVTTRDVQTRLGVTPPGASGLLRQLQQAGILQPTARVPGRSNRWIAIEVMSALRDDPPPR